MNKDEILEASRKENKNQDLVEMEIAYQAGSIAARAGAAVCVALSILARFLIGEYLLSPWVIYFSIVGTHWLVRALKTKKKSEFVVCALFLAIVAVLFVLLIMQLLRKKL